jgi:hypothetical protein
MRHLAAVVLVCVAAVACGTASPDGGEHSASTAEAVINPNPGCYSGYTQQCHVMNGRQLCNCVPLSCTFVNPPAPANSYAWAESWTMGSNDGSCPDIAAPTGTWKKFVPPPSCNNPWSFTGIPCESLSQGAPPPAVCSPGTFKTPSCCTYVWWPADYVAPTSCADASVCTSDPTQSQFTQVLCEHAGMTIVASQRTVCEYPCNGNAACRTCNQP